MENQTINVIYKSPSKVKRPRFSLPTGNKRMNGILGQSLIIPSPQENDSPITTLSSVDMEWTKLQKELEENKKYDEIFDELEVEDFDCVRELNFGSPNMKKSSLNDISMKREELQLMKKALELDEEVEFLLISKDAMEENFKTMFAEITYERIAEEQRSQFKKPKPPTFLYSLIQELELINEEENDILSWASKIEEKIEEEMK